MRKLFTLLLVLIATQLSAENEPITNITISLPPNPEAKTGSWGAGRSMFSISAQTASVLTLMTPANKAVLGEKELPKFSWTHTRQQPGPPSTYKIKIVEIKGSQSPEQAMRGNKPHFEKDSLKERFFQYPQNAARLESGKRYAWTISASRNPPYGEVKITESAINEFGVKPKSPNKSR